MLHTNFWRHGTVDTDIPLWCLSLMQQPQQSLVEIRRLAHDGSSFLRTFASHQFLDFLYPPRTQSFARSFARNPQNSPVLRRRKGVASRRYASSVDKSTGQNLEPNSSQTVNEVSRGSSTVGADGLADKNLWLGVDDEVVDTRSLEDILKAKSPSDYNRAWELYQQEGCPAPHTVVKLFRYLSDSDSSVDADRACTAFGSIPVESRSRNHYWRATKAAFRAESPHQRVMGICKEAIAREQGDQCWNLALAIALNRTDWNLLLDLWNDPFSLDDGPTRPPIITKRLTFEGLPDRLCSLLDAIESGQLALSDHGFADFVEILIQHVLWNETVIAAPLASILQIFQRLSALHLILSQHYLGAISRLLSSGSRMSAARSVLIYRNFRWRMPDEKPPEWLLSRIVFRICKYKMSDSLSYFLNQFRLFHEKPPEETYEHILVAYARLGGVSLVRTVFNNLVEDHGQPNERLISPLLYVHARLGDVEQTKSEFEKLSHTYPTVSQNVVFWNILLTAYSNAANLKGAISTFSDMGRAGILPDSHSYGVMMGLLAKRGDVEAVKKLVDAARRGGVPLTGPMVNTVVESLCRSGNLVDAEKAVHESCSMDTAVDSTRSWNLLLFNHAFRADVDSVSRIQAQMQQLGITFTDMTYAALMLSLVFIRDTESAKRILRKLHHSRRIHVNEFHYSIILHGYFKERNLDMVHILYKEMSERFGKAGPSADLTMLRTLIERDVQRYQEKGGASSDEPVEFNHSERFLESIMERFGVPDYAISHPQPGTQRRNLRDAFPSSYYEFVIGAYGSHRAFSKAEELHDKYTKKAEGLSNTGELPLRHLYVLMEQHFLRDRHDLVESCWKTALWRIRQSTGPVDIDPILAASRQSHSEQHPEEMLQRDKPDSVLRCNRFSLEYFLLIYIQSWSVQNLRPRIDDVISEIERMGFELTSKNWSLYIKMLCQSSRRAEQLRAFTIFEDKFAHNFPGWGPLKAGFIKRPPAAHEGLALMDAPRQVNENLLGRYGRRTWATIQPNYMQPTYLLVMHLASALVDFRMRSIVHGDGEMNTLFSKAPNTVRALSKIPYLRSKFHSYVVRHRDLPKSRAKEVDRPHHAVSTGGLLGVDDEPRIDTRPRETVWEEIEKSLGNASRQPTEPHYPVRDTGAEPGQPGETSEPDSGTLRALLLQDAEFERSLNKEEYGTAEDELPERTLSPQDEQDIEHENRLYEISREAEDSTPPLNEQKGETGGSQGDDGGAADR